MNMVVIEKEHETRHLGNLRANDLYELAGFIGLQNNSGHVSHWLIQLVEDARNTPDRYVYDYVREHTPKKD